MFDTIALLIGHVILAWSRLDQTIGEYAIGIQVGSYDSMEHGDRFEQPDDRFKHRLKLLRRLYVKHTGNDRTIMAEFDSLQTRIKALERKRAHFAHGSVTPDFDGTGVLINDRRESRAFERIVDAVFESREFPPVENMRALWEKHHNIKYTYEELSQLPEDMWQAGKDLSDIHRRVRKRSRELGMSPPLAS